MTPNTDYTMTLELKSGGGALLNSGAPLEVTIYRNGVLTSLVSTVNNISTGVYSLLFSVPDWIHGDVVDIHIKALIDSTYVYSKKSLNVNSKADLTIINEGVKKSSLIIPHDESI